MQAAIEAIGKSDSHDCKLRPADHLKDLSDEAAPLKRLLERESVRAIVTAYEHASGEASAARDEYKHYQRLSVYAVAGATGCAALALFLQKSDAAPSLIAPAVEPIRVALLAVNASLTGLLVYAGHVLRRRGLYRRWMGRRTATEHARIELFDAVLSAEESPKSDAELPLLPLQLEYFRRYQLDLELDYYCRRGKEHRAAAAKWIGKSGKWMAAGATATALVGAGLNPGDLLAAASLFLLALPIVLTLQAQLSLVDQDERNGQRYEVTYERLLECKKDLDAAREAAVHGRREEVLAWAKRVNDEISVEHREWINLQKAAAPASRDQR